MKTIRLVGTLILGLGAALPGLLDAQDSRLARDSATVVLLKPTRLVRFSLPAMGRVSGRIANRWGDTLALASNGTRQVISLGSIDTLWVRGRATKTGAIVGGILGIAGGLFLGALADGLCEYDCQNSDYLVTGGLLGLAAGAGTGAIIGAAIPRWRKVYPHRR